MKHLHSEYYLEPYESNPADWEDAKDAAKAFKDLHKELKKILFDTMKLFGVDAESYVQGFKNAVSETVDSWKTNIQAVKQVFVQSAEPVNGNFLTAVKQVSQKSTDMAQSVGAAFQSALGADALVKQVQQMVKAEKELKKTATSTASAVKRSLVGFDQLNRLTRPAAGSSGSKSTSKSQSDAKSLFQEMVDKVKKAIAPIEEVDFSLVIKGVDRLTSGLNQLSNMIVNNLYVAWTKVMIPLRTWSISTLGSESVHLLSRAFGTLATVLEGIEQKMRHMRQSLEAVTVYIGETALSALNSLQIQFGKMVQALDEMSRNLYGTFGTVGMQLSELIQRLQPMMTQMLASWKNMAGIIRESANTSRAALDGLLSFISGGLLSGWALAWDGMADIFKGFGNSVLGGLNSLLRGVVTGINGIIRSLNQIDFTLPGWSALGSLAGKRYRLNLQTISAPQIPYLARGAVLPANKPFLAMVGDQRHGTNVEAPLSTIQEAVAVVMEDLISSNLAGQERIVGALQQLLEAVADIRIGDEVIGRSAQRYNRKMAVVKGGYV